MDVVATRSQRQISTQLSGKAISIIRFNVRQRIKFVKKWIRHFRRPSAWTSSDIVSTSSNSVEQRLNSFALDISFVLRESWGISRYPSRNRACGVEKFSTPSASGLCARAVAVVCCQVLLKKAAKGLFPTCFYYRHAKFGWWNTFRVIL